MPIVDLPRPASFREAGNALLNLAWDYAAQLLRDLDDAKHHDGEDAERYWSAAHRRLTTALTLVHQGAEFLLKERIAAVSPYLLLASSPRDWPKGCAKTDTQFAEFRTVDSQDLVKIHDTCCPTRLPSDFVAEFEALRRKRNSIVHTLDRRLEVRVEEVLIAVLTVHTTLCPDEYWVETRAGYLSDEPVVALHSDDHVNGLTVWEFSLVAGVLKPAAMKRFFNFDKRKRRYACLSCHAALDGADMLPLSASLSADGKSTHCFVCGGTENVTRRKCGNPPCPGNVVTVDDGVCLTCGVG
jgi:hypothetical protein